ncbi:MULTISPECIES: hypothetical protein [unclassified Nonomuraea]|uniref:hypothetical protein n=1 Tax=unclassified Nonomuraea TaxID=2593643 RepID=UPI0013773651|nr:MULTISPECIES: hypothetical protein [unclassified Nonomuraea]NBE97237.1 hypothetical protein [Nonomuraea sp. K271]
MKAMCLIPLSLICQGPREQAVPAHSGGERLEPEPVPAQATALPVVLRPAG